MDDAARARAWHGQGRLQQAEAYYRSALQALPDDIPLRRDFAVMLMQSRREAEAAALLDQPAVLAQANADLLSILALCLRASGQHPRALQMAQRLNQADPANALGWLLSGSLQVLLGNPLAAEPALRRCTELEPALAEAWHYLGEALQRQRRWDEAIAAYQVAARSQPAEGFNIALCHELAGRIAQAGEGYQAVQQLMPGRADVLARLAQVQALQCLGDAEAQTTARLAAVLSQPLREDDAPEPFILSYLELDAQARAGALRHHAQRLQRNLTPLPPASAPAAQGSRLRLGYLSADFGPHAVGELVRGHFAAHDRSRFSVHGYSLRTHEGAVAQEIRRGFDAFTDCERRSDQDVAQAIRADGIDVLIDMAGFTDGARPRILALRPAPLQLGWLGFIHGHQAPWLDALLLDEHVWPDGMPWPYDDRVVRLPGTLLPGAPQRPARADRARFGLPEGVPLLASFNGSYKLNPALIAAWSNILRQAPQAHLAVFLPPVARAGFLHQWAALGGPPDRLHVLDKIAIDAQSDRAASCDLLLDAFRYQGGATTLGAIGSGLPVLTLEGKTSPLARLSAGINRFLGLHDLVCADEQAYVERSVALISDPARLRGLRELQQQQVLRCGLFDPRRVAASMEQTVLSLLGR